MPRSISATVLLLVPLLVFAVSCSTVQSRDLAGTWVMTEATRRRLPLDAQKAAAEIVLEESGAFTARDVPGLFAATERDARVLDSGRGVWRIVSLGGEPQLLLEFRQRSNSVDSTPFGRQLLVSRDSLYYFIGGPDAGLRVSFEKRQVRAAARNPE